MSFKFGASKCHPLSSLGREQCETHMDGDNYPCYWRLPGAKDCWGRNDSQSRKSRYLNKSYPYDGSSPSMSSMMSGPPPLPPRPAGYTPSYPPQQERGIYNCVGRSQSDCGSNPNCDWQQKARRCIRKAGHVGGTQYAGPMGPMSFGKKRYHVVGSPCNLKPARVCKSNPNCTSTKRGCRRRAGTKKGLIYEGPSLASFGKKRYNVPGSICNRKPKKICKSNPNCSYTKRGCRRRKGTKKGIVYEGPSLQGFGKKRYNVPGSICNRKSKKVCKSNPNCTSTKRGCRRRAGTKKGIVYEGPSLPGFGKSHSIRSVSSDIKALMKM